MRKILDCLKKLIKKFNDRFNHEYYYKEEEKKAAIQEDRNRYGYHRIPTHYKF